MSHQIIKDLSTRYTVKKYDTAKRISAEDIAVIKEAIRLSASSINSQPWKFILVESDEGKQRLHDTFANKHQFNQLHAKEASHTLLLAYDPKFTKEKFSKRVDAEVSSGHLPAEMRDSFMGAYAFAEMNTDENGNNGSWTKAQVYLALGNIMHTLARLGIASTPMEGVDHELIGEKFQQELDGHICEVALAMGYQNAEDDWNYGLPKARLAIEEIIEVV
ncbi:MAG: NAD(P)H-dependent oxidoreductase [Alteromonadaceae bacterium]|uniref:Nitroreductase family protein n=1 Tax=Paraglaciecola chathamensis TaxID=368405 RepID=A0ABS0WKI6_9ALTE|nr:MULTISPECIES: nitroreductase family protein [Paraglaciecola]MBJ2138992.1 nitroreductase family protein [Paraglaciecola chathamensis]MBN24121.1 NAD(P)H-dependent oxidoreductase [Alteromonadaceae bacterium]MDO6561567.1 nitroreductase family protein [Paraglaciecola chathamensis]MDO6842058.1 nitroreductase family protein [Paraglaciecola chathamensis]|tara:strand:- start:13039 stop:13695 length:657 start_codon:yes stop_codon:yes gene_type:complete